jgi:hypothetical protein
MQVTVKGMGNRTQKSKGVLYNGNKDSGRPQETTRSHLQKHISGPKIFLIVLEKNPQR